MHQQRDLANDFKVSQQLIPAVRTGDASATGLDRKGYNSAGLLVSLGNSGDTLSGSVYLTVKIEDSPDNSTWSAVETTDVVIPANAPTGLAAPDANGIVYTCDAPTEDSLDLFVAYTGEQRYIRATLDFTGTHTNGIPCSVSGVLGQPQFGPAG